MSERATHWNLKRCIYVYTHWPLSSVPGTSKVALINWPCGHVFRYICICNSWGLEDAVFAFHRSNYEYVLSWVCRSSLPPEVTSIQFVWEKCAMQVKECLSLHRCGGALSRPLSSMSYREGDRDNNAWFRLEVEIKANHMLPLHLLTLFFCKHQDEGIDYREKLKQSRLLLFTRLC